MKTYTLCFFSFLLLTVSAYAENWTSPTAFSAFFLSTDLDSIQKVGTDGISIAVRVDSTTLQMTRKRYAYINCATDNIRLSEFRETLNSTEQIGSYSTHACTTESICMILKKSLCQ